MKARSQKRVALDERTRAYLTRWMRVGVDQSTKRQWAEGTGPYTRVREYRHG